jgi:hypothetical protein
MAWIDGSGNVHGEGVRFDLSPEQQYADADAQKRIMDSLQEKLAMEPQHDPLIQAQLDAATVRESRLRAQLNEALAREKEAVRREHLAINDAVKWHDELVALRVEAGTFRELCQRFAAWFEGWCPSHTCCAESARPIADDAWNALKAGDKPQPQITIGTWIDLDT